MKDTILTLAYDLIVILVPMLVGFLVELLRRKLGVEKMKRIQQELSTKQDLAVLAVRFVEQVYKDYNGPEKYNKAAEWLVAQLEKTGLKFTTDEVKGLIEAALREIKDNFGDEWAKTIT